MKTKDKIIQLVEMGLSPETIQKLNETQINVLFNKISLSEQGAVMMSADKASSDPQKLKDLTSRGINVRIEGEVAEDNVDVMGSAMAGATTQAPHQIMSPDGMGDDSDAQIDKYEDMTEAETQDENNPWAICHAQLGPKKNAKFERCVKAVKKSLKEGTSPMDFFIEEKIVSLVENYLEPKMTKEEFLETVAEQGVIRRSVYKPKSKKGKSTRMSRPIGDLGMLQSMSEADTETAPVKPTTKPDTKPTTKPAHPGKKPFEGPNPAPKADTKTAPARPTTKPDTKPSVRPAHPGKKPFEGPNPAPKASKKELDKAKNDVLKLIQGILRDGKK